MFRLCSDKIPWSHHVKLEEFIWAYDSRGLGLIMAEIAWQQVADRSAGAESFVLGASYLESQTGSGENQQNVETAFKLSKHTNFLNDTPNFSQTAPPPGKQVFKCPRLWGHISFKWTVSEDFQIGDHSTPLSTLFFFLSFTFTDVEPLYIGYTPYISSTATPAFDKQ